jgi:hypothetical protein
MLTSPATPLVRLSRDFSKLYNNPTQADIVIRTATPDQTTFYAHSLILQCRSAYFDSALSDQSDKLRDEHGLIVFELPNINQYAFAMLLRYFYSGTVDWVTGCKPETTLPNDPTPNRKKRAKPRRRSSSAISTLQLLDRNNQSFLLSSDDESDSNYTDNQSELSLEQSVFSFASSSSGETDIMLPFQAVHLPKLKSHTDYDTQGKLLLDVLAAASELIVDSLMKPLQRHIVDKYHVYLRKHVFTILELADKYDWNMIRLRCTEILCMDPYAYFKGHHFIGMKSELLIEILHRSDLRMKEFDIWCACLYWAYNQVLKEHPNMISSSLAPDLILNQAASTPFERSTSPQPSRLSPEPYANDNTLSDEDETYGWSKEQQAVAVSVKKKMLPLIPCIRFLLIPGDKYLEFVEPYKIVPSYLRKRLLHHYIRSNQSSSIVLDNLPPRLSTPRETCIVNSSLINGYEKLYIDHWILGEKLNNCSPLIDKLIPRPSIAHPSYKESKWSLLYSSALHGPDMRSFHLRCDNKGPTVTLIKISKTNEIIGGYNSQSWRSEVGGRYGFARAFLFNLSGTGVTERKLSFILPSASSAKLSVDTNISDITDEHIVSPSSDVMYDSMATTPNSGVNSSLDDMIEKLQLTPEPGDVSESELIASPTSLSNTSRASTFDEKATVNSEESKTQVDDIESALSQAPLYPEPTLHSLKRAHLHYAIHNHAAYGPIFGGGHDLFIGNPIDEPNSFCRSYAYEGQILSGKETDFAIQEMEVWAIRIDEKCVFDSMD